MSVWEWMISWRPAPASSWRLWQLAIWASFALLIAGGLLAHLPRVFPGALSRTERARRGRWSGRLAGPLMLLAALFAGIVAASLILPLRQPVIMVLHSRARSAPSAALEEAAQQRRRPVYDLGPLVDRVLEACVKRGGASWVTGGPAEREQLRQAILEVALDVREDRLVGGSGPSMPSGQVQLPRWVVESAEVSVVQLISAQYWLEAVHVAAAPARGEVGSWPLAAVLLKSQGVPVECYRADITTTGNLIVERLAAAALRRSGTGYELSFYAILSGLIPKKAQPEVPFVLRAEDGEVLARFSSAVPADDYSRRVQSFSLPITLPGSAGGKALYLADVAGASAARVEIETAPASVELFVPDPAERKLWDEAFAVVRLPKFSRAYQPLVADLNAQRIPLPSVGGKATGPTLISADRFFVIGASQAVARSAAARYKTERVPKADNQPSKESVTALRVARSMLPAPAAFSWRNLPLRPADGTDVAQDTLTLPRGFDPLVWADRVVTPIRDGRATAGRRIWPVVSAGQLDGGRFVVVDPDASAGDIMPPAAGDKTATYEPAVFAALLYTVSWSAHFVTGGPSPALTWDAASKDVIEQERLVGPAVRREDVAAAATTGRIWEDRLCAAGLGLYVVLLAFRLRASRVGAIDREGAHA